MDDINLSDRIRQRAYKIWQSEGKPHGRNVIHWLRAEVDIRDALEGSGSNGKATTANRRAAAQTCALLEAGSKVPTTYKTLNGGASGRRCAISLPDRMKTENYLQPDLYIDARRFIFFQRTRRSVSEIPGPSQDIFGAAKAFINLAKAFHIVSMAEFPADDGICQSAQSVSVFGSVQHY